MAITSSKTSAKTRSLVLSGTASDDTGVTQVSWSNDRGGSGLATGTSPWTATIPLQGGTNVITITAGDGAGKTGTKQITVTF